MCNVIKEKFTNNQLINKLPVVQFALENNLFKDYSPNHLFARQETIVLNLITNLFNRLETLRQRWGDDVISDIISDKLASGKINYNEDTFRQVLSEIEVITYFPRIMQKFLDDLKYEPKFNNNKNPEIEFSFQNNRYQIEVKSPTFKYKEEITDGDIFINYRVNNDRLKEISSQNITCHFPQDNKLKDYLISAQEKFSSECADRKSNVFGILFVNWDNFVSFNIDPTFDNLDSIFFNPISGIFTENSFIVENNNPVRFDRVNGVLLYQRIITGEYDKNEFFTDYRLYKKYFIQNPFSKDVPQDFINQILLAPIRTPKKSYKDMTILDI